MDEAAALWGDDEARYRAVVARDRRFDGRFVLAVTTTGIYCRPSCPARTPLPANVRYFAVPAAAVAAGFRACKRCRPDAVPGSRLWDHQGDLAARALHLVSAGAVDELGVSGLADRLSVSERHLHRTLVQEVGVGPLALARTRRAQTARLLLEQTELSVTDVGFAAGFASIRQFNDVMRAEFGSAPSKLRGNRAAPDRPADPGVLTLRLSAREPFDGDRLLSFLGARAIRGVEQTSNGYLRAVATRSGPALVRVTARDHGIVAELRLPDLVSLQPTVTVLRRLFDLDADAPAIDDAFAADPLLGPSVSARPGLRVPGGVAGFEVAVRAVVGQQISVDGARTILGRIVERCGESVSWPSVADVTHTFPSAKALADADLAGLGLTGRRIDTLHALARAVADGELDLDPSGDAGGTRARLLAISGIGPWTVEYVAMRALQDPDAFPQADLVLKRRCETARVDPTRWRPWRAYAAIHLWTQAAEADR